VLDTCGVLGLLVTLGLGLWLATIVVAFGAGFLVRRRFEGMLRR